MSCTYLNGSRITRHDRLVQVIARVARLSGVSVQLEPRIDGEDRSRGDGHLFFHHKRQYLTPMLLIPVRDRTSILPNSF